MMQSFFSEVILDDFCVCLGLDQEGIFRVSGNAKIQERLRNSFDRSGDADLDDAGDVMAVAGLLKLFLRELPDCVIPQTLTARFVAVQEGECVFTFPLI